MNDNLPVIQETILTKDIDKQSHRYQQLLFASKYIECGMIGSKAVQAAFGSHISDATASSRSVGLLRKHLVKAEIRRHLALASQVAQVNLVDTLAYYKEARDTPITEFIGTKDNGSGIYIKNLDDIPKHLMKYIQSLQETKDGIKIVLIDKLASNNKLFEYLGGSAQIEGKTNNIQININLSNDELNAL